MLGLSSGSPIKSEFGANSSELGELQAQLGGGGERWSYQGGQRHSVRAIAKFWAWIRSNSVELADFSCKNPCGGLFFCLRAELIHNWLRFPPSWAQFAILLRIWGRCMRELANYVEDGSGKKKVEVETKKLPPHEFLH